MAGDTDNGAGGMPPGLEHSRPVFDRATRLARSLFGKVEAQVTLKTEDGYWRSRGGIVNEISRAAGVRAVMQTGEVVWIEDAKALPRYAGEP